MYEQQSIRMPVIGYQVTVSRHSNGLWGVVYREHRQDDGWRVIRSYLGCGWSEALLRAQECFYDG